MRRSGVKALIFIGITKPGLIVVPEILIAKTPVGANKRTFTFSGEPL